MEGHDPEDSSEDEVFCGRSGYRREFQRRLELQRRILRRSISVVISSDESDDSSLELIEAQSEPELIQDTLSPEEPRPSFRRSLSQPDMRQSLAPPRTWDAAVSEESFLAMENFVSKIEDTSADSDDLDTTLERVDKILKIGLEKEDFAVTLRNNEVNITTPNNIKKQNFTSSLKKPITNGVKATLTFKTPAKPAPTTKSVGSGLKIPGRSPLRGPSPFSHIASPVQFYIKHSPQAPLIHNVRPRRPLPGFSSIPKPVEPSGREKANKENITSNILPPKAYVGAKETKLIITPDTKHLPKNNQVKKMASALPHPIVTRHERREKPLKNKPALQCKPDESYSKLSVSQADISVHVVKSVGITETLKRH